MISGALVNIVGSYTTQMDVLTMHNMLPTPQTLERREFVYDCHFVSQVKGT